MPPNLTPVVVKEMYEVSTSSSARFNRVESATKCRFTLAPGAMDKKVDLAIEISTDESARRRRG